MFTKIPKIINLLFIPEKIILTTFIVEIVYLLCALITKHFGLTLMPTVLPILPFDVIYRLNLVIFFYFLLVIYLRFDFELRFLVYPAYIFCVFAYMIICSFYTTQMHLEGAYQGHSIYESHQADGFSGTFINVYYRNSPLTTIKLDTSYPGICSQKYFLINSNPNPDLDLIVFCEENKVVIRTKYYYENIYTN